MGYSWKTYLLLVVIFIAGLAGGYFLRPLVTKTPAQVSLQSQANPLFATTRGTIIGQITGVKDLVVTVKNPANQSAGFPLAKNFKIYQMNGNNLASSSATINSLQGKTVVVTVELINNQYQIISITYR
ncbi:hypothetical protein HY389_01980 [Candidatus Daviesbacteria bacterium]|nr:hypothetical protein [Candidatus Daviesbacteria bacterium]